MVARRVQQIFKAWSSFYGSPILQKPFYRRVHAAVMSEVTAPRSLLDIGCGTGQLLGDLVDRFPAARAIGVDLSRHMLAVARRRLPARTGLVCCNVYALPLADHAVELALSTISYHWYLEPQRALAEVHRVVAPGGRFVLATLVAPVPAELRTMRVTTVDGIAGQLAAAGFQVERVTRVRPMVAVFAARNGA